MTREESCSKIEDAIQNIDFKGNFADCNMYGNGHINDTFVVRYTQEDGSILRYILQRINHEVFKDPVGLMENVAGVTEFLRNKILENNGNADGETINLIKTKDGKNFYQDSIESYWRGYRFIEDAACYDKVEKPDDFYQSALAFGHFQNQLSDYPAETLHETIKDFHNTPDRFMRFKKALEEDILGRAKNIQEEIRFVLDREQDTHILMDLYKKGEMPLRVTHNDTKLNNIMIDNKTGKAICVIDLDTVMSGFAVNDFGDSIRFGASTGAEDEKDLSKVNFDLGLYELYTKGFLEGCNGSLTDVELDMLPVGAKIMTLECGIRFLTDYLQGDTYFKIHREGHNLDRCRTQFKLVSDMEKQWDAMYEIVNKYR
ncbi:phosphotransferase enzyme family protein [Anaerocolumna xylanovorans]|uniref:Phosphotransferase enzyme family protein n=1 Tax=Anaerocolumna xylanovorans DSM 12503 TaxID=1121345 RepID=A0A1M7YHF4_9FIRM|nr:aminoglycoside phosphotransferase family protein [Anaerocolumna xylanovorans]SHO52067.1 Phosphotransferase enzyme family protein [Anaerocolumna xylanovorans DSM 12503]